MTKVLNLLKQIPRIAELSEQTATALKRRHQEELLSELQTFGKQLSDINQLMVKRASYGYNDACFEHKIPPHIKNYFVSKGYQIEIINFTNSPPSTVISWPV